MICYEQTVRLLPGNRIKWLVTDLTASTSDKYKHTEKKRKKQCYGKYLVQMNSQHIIHFTQINKLNMGGLDNSGAGYWIDLNQKSLGI